jgi:hypothetical protein
MKPEVAQEILERLCRIEDKIDGLALSVITETKKDKRRDHVMSQQLNDLIREVQESRTVEEGLAQVVDQSVALLGDLKSRLDAAIASGDAEQLAALAAELDAQQQAMSAKKDELIAAVTANTPAAPAV